MKTQGGSVVHCVPPRVHEERSAGDVLLWESPTAIFKVSVPLNRSASVIVRGHDESYCVLKRPVVGGNVFLNVYTHDLQGDPEGMLGSVVYARLEVWERPSGNGPRLFLDFFALPEVKYESHQWKVIQDVQGNPALMKHVHETALWHYVTPLPLGGMVVITK